jgi:ZIP family zinc transporter
MHWHIGIPLLLTVLAGLSTGIGSALAYFIRKPKMVYLSVSLGFSAGVMIYISFMELLPKSIERVGEALSVGAFFVGIVFIGLIDFLIPKAKNPHHYGDLSNVEKAEGDKSLLRTGLFTALAIGIHNFPEGLAIFATTLSDVKLGLFIAIAIAIHNVPEGISVSIPLFYATGNRNKAFVYSFLSGLSEPVGAIIGFLILMPFLSEVFISSLLASVAGIMVYISVDEILPTAHRSGHGHSVILGIVLGMLIMALSLLMVR